MLTDRRNLFGVIVPNLHNHYYSEMLIQILQTYEQFGYKFLVFVGNEHADTERKYIEELMSYKIEGLIILSFTIPSRELADLHLPIVTIERENKYVCSVNTDNYMGGVQATSLACQPQLRYPDSYQYAHLSGNSCCMNILPALRTYAGKKI